jgi:hypothetical protein
VAAPGWRVAFTESGEEAQAGDRKERPDRGRELSRSQKDGRSGSHPVDRRYLLPLMLGFTEASVEETAFSSM